jgi:hypothetical protein
MTKNKDNSWGCLGAIFRLFFKSNSRPSTFDSQKLEKELMPFRLRDDFLSTAEHSFYLVLKSMMGAYFVICPKVSLSDIFYVIRPNENQSSYNRINRKHIDFLICDAETIKPRFAIELDDKSHDRQDRIERDEFVNELFETANLPLVRIPVRPTYNVSELGIQFREALQKGKTGLGAQTDTEESNYPAGSTEASPKNPPCPRCGQPMVLRTAQNGQNKGRRFYGCVNYPKCKTILPVD